MSAFLRGDPLDDAVHGAEDMGAGGGGLREWILERHFALLVAAEAAGGGDLEMVGGKILCGKDEIPVEVGAFERVGVAATGRVRRGLGQRFKTQRGVWAHGGGLLTVTRALVIE